MLYDWKAGHAHGPLRARLLINVPRQTRRRCAPFGELGWITEEQWHRQSSLCKLTSAPRARPLDRSSGTRSLEAMRHEAVLGNWEFVYGSRSDESRRTARHGRQRSAQATVGTVSLSEIGRRTGRDGTADATPQIGFDATRSEFGQTIFNCV